MDPEVKPAADPAQTKIEVKPETPATPAKTGNDELLEQVKSLSEKFAASEARNEELVKKVNGLHAAKRRVLEGKSVEPTKTDDVASLAAQFAKLRKEKDDADREIKEEKKNLAIESAVNQFGLDDEGRETITALFKSKYGNALKVEGRNVFFEAEDKSKKTVSELVASMKPVIERLTPAKPLPTGTAKNGKSISQGTKREITREDLASGNYSAEDLRP